MFKNRLTSDVFSHFALTHIQFFPRNTKSIQSYDLIFSMTLSTILSQ